jgi:phosphatidylinositol alpha-1,6-mannosyltransferase
MNEKRSTKKILFLTLHTFSLTGGIEKVCCSLAKVLNDLSIEIKDLSFNLYAMHDGDKDIDTRYLKAENFKGFKGRKLDFLLSTIGKGIRANTIILSHINLLFFAYLIKKLSPTTRIIMYAHGIELWRQIPSWKVRFLQESVEIWAVSKYTASTLTAMHQISAAKIKIINNCLDPYFQLSDNFEKPIKLLERHHLNAAQPILFTLTRLSSQETYKGYDRVFSAMPALLNKFPTLHYILAGKADEQEYKRVTDLINQMGLNAHVTLTGFINDDELSDYFKLGNVFVMPSTMEGFGIVFIEAAACGAKIIAGNVDGSVDALLNGKLGTLVNPTDVSAIALAIEETLNSNYHPQLVQEICLANFGYGQYLKNTKELIN